MKIFLLLIISITVIFASINVNSASKEELMSIKGIGEKKANSIIKYRKSHKIKTLDDLHNVKGISTATINNIKNDVKSTDKKSKKTVSKDKSKSTKKTVEKSKKRVDKKSKKKITKSKDEKKKSKNKDSKKSKDKSKNKSKKDSKKEKH